MQAVMQPWPIPQSRLELGPNGQVFILHSDLSLDVGHRGMAVTLSKMALCRGLRLCIFSYTHPLLGVH